MSTRSHPNAVFLVLLIISSLTILPASALAQIGLHWEPTPEEIAARNSKFDNGKLKSQSALGQLEEMSGGKVDRSSNSSSNRNSNTRPVQQPRPAKPRYNANQVLKQELAGALTGALVGALFNSLLNDNSAQQRAQAEAEAAARAAAAAAAAEAFRVQQELARQARIRQAQHYRADWDARESEITNRLGNAFEVRSGTAFFGTPANPDAATIAAIIGDTAATETEPVTTSNTPPNPGVDVAADTPDDLDDSDPSVVDLRGSSLVVQPRGVVSGKYPTRPSGSLMPRWAYDWAEPETRRHRHREPSKMEELLAYLGPRLGDWYKENVISGTIQATLWGKAKKIPGVDYIKGVYDFNEQRTELTNEMSGIYNDQIEETFGSASTVARIVSNPYSNGGDYAETNSAELDYRARKVTAKFYELAYGRFISGFETPDLGELETPVGDGFMPPVNGAGNHSSTHLRLSNLKNFVHF